jgi:serine/threonine protein kinase
VPTDWTVEFAKNQKTVFKDPQALDLLKRMLVIDPKHRITIKDALEHPFFLSEKNCLTDEHRKLAPKKMSFEFEKAVRDHSQPTIQKYLWTELIQLKPWLKPVYQKWLSLIQPKRSAINHSASTVSASTMPPPSDSILSLSKTVDPPHPKTTATSMIVASNNKNDSKTTTQTTTTTESAMVISRPQTPQYFEKSLDDQTFCTPQYFEKSLDDQTFRTPQYFEKSLDDQTFRTLSTSATSSTIWTTHEPPLFRTLLTEPDPDPFSSNTVSFHSFPLSGAISATTL